MSDAVVIRQFRTSCFTVLGNEVIRDRRLSYRARGLHHVLLSLAEGYQLRVSWLVDQSTDGRHSVLSGLKELQLHGYLEIRRERNVSGRFVRTVWVVTDTPAQTGGAPESEIQTVGEESHQNPDFGSTENRTVSTEEPSVERTTTTYSGGVEAAPDNMCLVVPRQLSEGDKPGIVALLREVPVTDAQTLLDELASALEAPGTIKTTPGRWFWGLVQKYAQGKFNPVGAHIIAARRAKPKALVKVDQTAAANPEVARAHIAKIAAGLHIADVGAK